MTVRVLFRDYEEPQTARRGWRWAEYLFLFAGLIGLDYYIWVSLDSTYHQAYESWSFDQQLKGERVSFWRFLVAELGLTTSSDESRSRTGEETPSPNVSKPAPLSVIGRIAVPRLQLSAMVREGIGDDILREAVGHIPTTAMPGQLGNVSLAGHRDTFFRKLKDIRKNDRIVISTLHGEYAYQVESLKIVLPKDVSVLKPVAGEQNLTLVTCYPFYYVGNAPKRFIVRAKQIEISPQQQQPGS